MLMLDCTMLFTNPCALVEIGPAPSGKVTVLRFPGTPPLQLPLVDQFKSVPAPLQVLCALASWTTAQVAKPIANSRFPRSRDSARSLLSLDHLVAVENSAENVFFITIED